MDKPKSKIRSPYFITPAGYVLGIGLSGGAILIGVYFAVCSIIEGQATERTEGTVISLQKQSDGRSSRPVVEYEVNGKSYQCTGKVGTNFDKVGDKIAVLYKIDQPEIGYVDSFAQRWGIPLVFCLFGGFFLSAILHYALFGRKSDRTQTAKNQRSKNVRIDEGNRRIVIRWFSPICWGLLFFCIVWGVFLTLGLEDAGILSALFILLGVGVTYLTLALFCNRTSVSMRDSQLRVFHWPLPWIGNKILASETISHLQCVPGITLTGAMGPYKTLGNIKATLSDGSECIVLRNLDKSDALLVQRQLERWLKADHRKADEQAHDLESQGGAPKTVPE